MGFFEKFDQFIAALTQFYSFQYKTLTGVIILTNTNNEAIYVQIHSMYTIHIQ